MNIPNIRIKNYDFIHKMANSNKPIILWLYIGYFCLLILSLLLKAYGSGNLNNTVSNIPLVILIAFLYLIFVTPLAYQTKKIIENNKIVEGMELYDFWELVKKHPEEQEDIHDFYSRQGFINRAQKIELESYLDNRAKDKYYRDIQSFS